MVYRARITFRVDQKFCDEVAEIANKESVTTKQFYDTLIRLGLRAWQRGATLTNDK